MSNDHKTIAIAVIRHKGRVLIARRGPGEVLEGYWEFPGGKVDPGERPEDAAVRECREELGCAVHVGEILEQTDFDYDHGKVRLLFFDAQLVGLEPPHHHPRQWRWAATEELGDYRFPPANEAILRRLREASG